MLAALTVQDALVTLAALAALAILVRPFLPARFGGPRRAPDGTPCTSCAAGNSAKARARGR